MNNIGLSYQRFFTQKLLWSLGIGDNKYDMELRCLNTKGKYGKVTNTEIK